MGIHLAEVDSRHLHKTLEPVPGERCFSEGAILRAESSNSDLNETEGPELDWETILIQIENLPTADIAGHMDAFNGSLAAKEADARVYRNRCRSRFSR